jgi:flavorubredoxin
MRGPYKATPISDHVYWVGAVDWDIRDFHGYATSRGTSYNAYLVTGDDLDRCYELGMKVASKMKEKAGG